eukprot:426884_1
MAESKPEKVALDRYSRYLWKISTKESPMFIVNMIELSDKIETNKLIEICNSKFLKYFRLKARIDKNGYYFTEIPSFDCKNVIKEIQIPSNISPTDEYLLHCQYDFYFKHTFDTTLPLWRIQVLQFKSKSCLMFKFHHSLFDGAVNIQLIQLLAGKDSNLTTNWKPIHSTNWKQFRERNPILPHFRMLNNIIRYSYNKWKHPEKKHVFDPENGTKCKYCISKLEVPMFPLTKLRKSKIKSGEWIKHSFGNFLLCIVAEALIHFMKYNFHMKDSEIPTGCIINTPVELRRFYPNHKNETIFGTVDGSYTMFIPLNPLLSFNERLKLIKERQEYCRSINEHHSMVNFIYSQTFVPNCILHAFMKWGSPRYPIVLSGIRLFGYDNLRILGTKIEKMYTPLCMTPGLPFGITYVEINGKLGFVGNMDVGICGENGAKLFMQSLKYVLVKYGCVEKEKSKL